MDKVSIGLSVGHYTRENASGHVVAELYLYINPYLSVGVFAKGMLLRAAFYFAVPLKREVANNL